MVDEDGETMGNFFGAQPYNERMTAALVWPHSTEPGRQWVYHTSDTFIVTRAMHNYLQEMAGSMPTSTNLWWTRCIFLSG